VYSIQGAKRVHGHPRVLLIANMFASILCLVH